MIKKIDEKNVEGGVLKVIEFATSTSLRSL